MFQFSSRSRVFSLPVLASSWLMVAPALAQTAAAPAPPAAEEPNPQFTLGSHPASAIATTHRSHVGPEARERALVITQPDPLSNIPTKGGSADSVVIIPITARLSAPAPVAPTAAPVQRVDSSGKLSIAAKKLPATVVTAPKASRVTYRSGLPRAFTVPTSIGMEALSETTGQISKVVVPDPKTATPTIAPAATSKTTVVTVNVPATTLAASTPRESSSRENAAHLPSRGGLILNSGPVAVVPAPQTSSAAISPEQRVLLAKLDSDLEKAQRRLDSAETNLTEDQKQLANFTSVLRTAMLDAGDDAPGLHPFVRVAQRYLGTPYVWGGESARGFDCSGFIMRVMRDLGYQALPHSAAEQFNYGTPIAKPLLKPGDIVFFANTYKPGISHVGIYLGRGRFIHAANSHVGTIVSSLNEPKWIEKYAGARRLLSRG